ncbi:hypothetical protein SeMB42_g01709 [Synchytrium endobioticum]|uniref:RGS domain-containing protein n=1 Tax=Synchytrium endobioticum TaxID=286115 RepID=A0A507DL74_9FUNG|nr:hypothetical protein SeMB42_g01709 [Synchytrium endobioticum]
MDLANLYQVRNPEQKVKIVQLLGESRIPIKVGHGSTSKLSRHLALNVPNPPSSNTSGNVRMVIPYGSSIANGTEPRRGLSGANANGNGMTAGRARIFISPAAEPRTLHAHEAPSSPADSVLQQELIPHSTSSSSVAYPPRTLAQSRGSSRKLGQIFGCDAPIDVGIRELEEGRLAALLQSRIPLLYFLAMTIVEQNAENLLFWVDSKIYEEKIHSPGEEAMILAAEAIFHTYLSCDAPLEINISHKTLRSVIDGLRKGSRWCFVKAREDVWTNLDMAFARFSSSSLYTQMVHDLGFSCLVSTQSMSNIKQILLNALAAHPLLESLPFQICRRNEALQAKTRVVVAELSFGALTL